MKHSFLAYLSFLFIIMTLNGCLATSAVGKIGRYSSSVAPEQAIILPDGRVVIDFSDKRWTASGNLLYLYKRVYFDRSFFIDFKNTHEPVGNEEGILKDPSYGRRYKYADNFEYLIFHYIDTVKVDDVRGDWMPMLLHPIMLPPVPEAPACSRINRQFFRPDYYPDFVVCNEQDSGIMRAEVKTKYEEEKRAASSYIAPLLYVPAVVIDIVFAPIEGLIILNGMRDFARNWK